MKRIHLMSAVVATLVASAWGVTRLPAQQPAIAGLSRVDSMAAAEFAHDSVASLTIGVVTAQGLVWTKSYGFADMETRRLANRQSVYRIGSITKMFTALMLHQLVAEGKIRVWDPVERYYPEIREIRGYSRLSAPITVLQLATMVSGIAREPKEEGPFWTGPVSLWDSTLHSALPHTDMEFVPGMRFFYSNIGYAILGAALGRAAGVPYVHWEKEHILAPLGMRHTAFEIEPSIASDVTRGYDIADNGKPNSGQADLEARTGRGFKVPNGALYTTVDDLSRFLVLQLGHGPPEVVLPARLDSAYAAVVAANGELIASYGLGFSVERRGDFTWYGHSGGVAGFAAMMYFDRKQQLGVIVLRNAADGRVRPGFLATDVLQYLVSANAPARKAP
jgi:CubicO group peptidase (beta-lactamase class C family)